MDAWQYAGTLADAPYFVDRNWAGFDDGPALRVPHYARPDGEPVICRVGDYVVRQEVTLAEGLPSSERVEVWPKEEFERLFIPSRISGRDIGAPKSSPTRPGTVTAPSPNIDRPPDVKPRQADLEELLDDLDPRPSEGQPEPPAAA
jgi:hypothetical protein